MPPARSCAASSCPGASPCWPAARPRRRHHLHAVGQAGQAGYAIGENRYLADHASTFSYDVTITIDLAADTWSYDETTMLKMDEFAEPLAHTDHNTLRRVS